jgi:ankyrin repeat protein
MASENGHLEIVQLLLADDRVDPSANDNYPIRIALENGHLQIVQLLLADRRVDPSALDNYAVQLA